MKTKTIKKKYGWGGARPGAGRPRSPDSGVPHTPRPPVSMRKPVLLTLRGGDVPSFLIVQQTIDTAVAAATGRFGFHVDEWGVKKDRILVVVRAKDRTSLSRGAQGMSVRLARRINATLRSSGEVFCDRYEVSAATGGDLSSIPAKRRRSIGQAA